MNTQKSRNEGTRATTRQGAPESAAGQGALRKNNLAARDTAGEMNSLDKGNEAAMAQPHRGLDDPLGLGTRGGPLDLAAEETLARNTDGTQRDGTREDRGQRKQERKTRERDAPVTADGRAAPRPGAPFERRR